MPLKEVVLKEGTIGVITHINVCDICNEHKSEHTCGICNKWICDVHSIHVNIEIGDGSIFYVCTECHDIKRYDETYSHILKRIEEQYNKLIDSRDMIVKEWKEKIKKG